MLPLMMPRRTAPMAKVQGWDRLKRRLEKIPKAVREQTQPSITSAADDVAEVIRALAPKDDGDLRDSIEVTGG
ncbi:HK97 gp10 family phage protein, partial [Agrobacterium pusense]|uniref:HK97 gp10 family phage protein n=3 Tax=Agrobacterium pusense TaxID=648995 RepID=UPI001AEE99A3